MNKNTYKIINRFECCGRTMVTVIIENKAVCAMPEIEFNQIIEVERKYCKQIGLKVA